MNRPTKETLMLLFMYVLVFAAMSPWPYQGAAYNLFIFLTVVMFSIPLIMLFQAERCIDDVMEKVRAGEIPEQKVDQWKSFPKRVSITYVPMILLLVLAGGWILAIMWSFMYVVMFGLGKEVIRRLEEESKCTTGTL